MTKKRYVLVGTGGRSLMYIKALTDGTYREQGELVGLCDINPGRLEYYSKKIENEFKHPRVPVYKAADFDRMIEECRPDTVIVTTIDRTHHRYGCRAMELGCDVISEKPMTTDIEKCQAIVNTRKETGRNYTVTFNYRYAPRNSRIKELLQSGICGTVTSVNFEWLLDTNHGADYFRRWHRCKRNSGGLLVHKATHHFDLVNWWLDSHPVEVFAMGDLKFYGRENAEKRGIEDFYQRSSGSETAKKDPFALNVGGEVGTFLKELYFDNEKYDGYQRDQSVFGDGIDIEDNMNVMVRYANKVVMNYNLCAHSPYEGYRVCFNGTAGRLEFYYIERGITPVGEDMSNFGLRENEKEECNRKNMSPEIVFQEFWKPPRTFTYEKGTGGHGGGDVRLLDDLFLGAAEDPLGRAAGVEDGLNSVLTGIAANISIRTGRPVKVSELVNF